MTGLTAAIVGSGNIGTDLMVKLLRSEPSRPAGWSASIPPASGLARARAGRPAGSAEGIDWLLSRDERPDLVFEATSAQAHAPTPRDAQAGNLARRSDPGGGRPVRRPAASTSRRISRTRQPQHGDLRRSGDGPDRHAVSSRRRRRYAEIVASIASRSAGPGTRANIDEFTETTARAVGEVGGADRGKAIIILNPAEPPLMMRDTVICSPEPAPTGTRSRLDSRWSRTSPAMSRAIGSGSRRSSTRRPGDGVPGGAGARRLPARVRRQPGHHDRGRGARRRGARPGAPGGPRSTAGGGGRPPDERGCADASTVDGHTVRVTDTLRDGSHAVRHQLTAAQVRASSARSTAPACRCMEVTHGDGLGGSSFTYGFSHTPDRELIAAAAQTARRARIAALLLPGIGTTDDIRAVAELGASVVRIATHCSEADISVQHFRARP